MSQPGGDKMSALSLSSSVQSFQVIHSFLQAIHSRPVRLTFFTIILYSYIIFKMVSLVLLIASLASAGLIEGAAVDVSSKVNIVARQQRGGQGGGQQGGQQNGRQNGQNGGGQNGGQNGGQTCLNNNLIQSASGLTGQETGTEGIKPGQAPSAV
jgi:hypothetical protein